MKVLWRWSRTERSVFTDSAAGSKVRNFGRCGTGHRKSRGRDDGGDHGSGKSANYADPWVEKSDYGSAYPYLQYRYGNGISADLHREALIATAVVLFVLILIINMCCSALQRRNGQ